MIKKNSRIYIAGHKGLVGSAVLKKLKNLNYKNLIVRTKKQLDLTNARRVEFFFKKKKIEYLIICAAQVGGIVSNQNNPTEFFINNSLIQINLLKMALKYKLKKIRIKLDCYGELVNKNFNYNQVNTSKNFNTSNYIINDSDNFIT